MTDVPGDNISAQLDQLYATEIGGTFYGPSGEVQRQVPEALFAIAGQSSEAKDQVINALIQLLEEDADGGADEAFRIACDLLTKLGAVEAIDTLVKYIDYQPGIIGASLYHRPAVKALVQFGEAAIPKIGEALIAGESRLCENNHLLRHNALTALVHIGGSHSLQMLEAARLIEGDEMFKASIEQAIQDLGRPCAPRNDNTTNVKLADQTDKEVRPPPAGRIF